MPNYVPAPDAPVHVPVLCIDLPNRRDTSEHPARVRLYRMGTRVVRVLVDFDRRDAVYKVLRASYVPGDGLDFDESDFDSSDESNFVEFYNFMKNYGRALLLEEVVKLLPDESV